MMYKKTLRGLAAVECRSALYASPMQSHAKRNITKNVSRRWCAVSIEDQVSSGEDRFWRLCDKSMFTIGGISLLIDDLQRATKAVSSGIPKLG